MRTLATALLLANTSAKPVKSVVSDVALGIEGFLEGALEAEGLTDIESCIKDVETVVTDAEQTYKDCTVHDLSHKVKCTADLAKLAKAAKTSVSDCKGITADWQKLEDMIKIFSNPTAFAWHTLKDLIVNGVDIFHEVQAAMTAFKAKDWKNFGLNLGEASAKVLLGSQLQGLVETRPLAYLANQKEEQNNKTLSKEDYAKMVKGIYEAFGGHFDILALLICIQDEDKALIAATLGVGVFEQAFGEWKAGKKGDAIGDFIGGILTELAAYQSFEQGLPACKAIYQKTEDLTEFHQAKTAMKNPLVFQPYKDDLQINGFSIVHKIEEAMAALEDKDYEQFGFIMGEIMKVANMKKAEEPFTIKAPKPQKDMRDVTEVLQGFYAGTGVNMSFLDILVCIY